MARHLDGLQRIGPDGTWRWQLGGRDGTLALAGDVPDWSHPHFSYAADGELLVFDNGVHADRPARVVAYALDEALGSATLTWSWEPDEDVLFLGDARRLPGGNVLVALADVGRMVEVTRGGRIVWSMRLVPTNGQDQTIARVTFVADLDALDGR